MVITNTPRAMNMIIELCQDTEPLTTLGPIVLGPTTVNNIIGLLFLLQTWSVITAHSLRVNGHRVAQVTKIHKDPPESALYQTWLTGRLDLIMGDYSFS